MNKALLRSIMVLNGDTYQTFVGRDGKWKKQHSVERLTRRVFKAEMQFIREKYNLTADQFIEMFFTDRKERYLKLKIC